MNKTLALLVAIIILLVCSFLTRVSDEVLKSIVVLEMEEELRDDAVVNEMLLVDLAIPTVKSILEENIVVKDIFFYKLVETNGIVTGKYVSVFGRLFSYDNTQMDINLFSLWYQNNTGNNPEKSNNEEVFQLEEMYTIVSSGDDSESYKILKFDIAIIYTNTYFKEILESGQEEVNNYLVEYFKDKKLDDVNSENDIEKVKEDIHNYLLEFFETDDGNITRILFTDFSIK